MYKRGDKVTLIGAKTSGANPGHLDPSLDGDYVVLYTYTNNKHVLNVFLGKSIDCPSWDYIWTPDYGELSHVD